MKKMNLFEEEKEIKQTYKDSFFTKLYSEADAVCDLYNKELHPEDLITEKEVEIVTLDNILVNSYYNDLGFLVKDKLIILVEHQSTVNGNMPLRMLIYLVEEYKRYITKNNLNLHRRTPIKLPKPELFLIYTGEEEYKSTKLTFGEEGDSLYVNLNFGFIREAKTVDSTLEGYLSIIKRTESIKQEEKLEEIKEAIDDYLEREDRNPILAKFLINHRTEAIEMLKERLEIEKIMEARFEDGQEAGREEGKEEGREEGIKGMVSALKDLNIEDNIIIQKLQEKFSFSIEEAQSYLKRCK